MQILVKRLWETKLSVCGQMYVDGILQCYTLEPARVNPVIDGHPCIPAGTYGVIFTLSPHLKYITPELVDVPGRTDIRIHIANYPNQVLGCTAVGQTHKTDFVGHSEDAFDALMTKLKGQTVTAIYTDPIAA